MSGRVTWNCCGGITRPCSGTSRIWAAGRRISLCLYGLGDWYDLGPKPPGVAQLTPVPLTATAFYYADTATLARVARLLGQAADAGRYEQSARDIGEAFNQQFFDSAQNQYAQGSQCANSMPLAMGLVPAAESRRRARCHRPGCQPPRECSDRRRRGLPLPAASARRREAGPT